MSDDAACSSAPACLADSVSVTQVRAVAGRPVIVLLSSSSSPCQSLLLTLDLAASCRGAMEATTAEGVIAAIAATDEKSCRLARVCALLRGIELDAAGEWSGVESRRVPATAAAQPQTSALLREEKISRTSHKSKQGGPRRRGKRRTPTQPEH